MTQTITGQEKISGSMIVPKYFSIGCAQARYRIGNHDGYSAPAWHLSIHLFSELAENYESNDLVANKIEELERYLSKEDNKAAIAWFRQELPGCMSLVPRQRHASFLKGVYSAFEEDRLYN